MQIYGECFFQVLTKKDEVFQLNWWAYTTLLERILEELEASVA